MQTLKVWANEPPWNFDSSTGPYYIYHLFFFADIIIYVPAQLFCLFQNVVNDLQCIKVLIRESGSETTAGNSGGCWSKQTFHIILTQSVYQIKVIKESNCSSKKKEKETKNGGTTNRVVAFFQPS